MNRARPLVRGVAANGWAAFALLPVLLPTAGPARADDGFAAFHASFRAAMQSPEVDPADAVVTLTRLPFLYQGRSQDAAGFRRSVWPALFTPALRRCWARAQPLSEPGQSGERSLHCAPYALHFDAAGGRWQLREFSADAGQ